MFILLMRQNNEGCSIGISLAETDFGLGSPRLMSIAGFLCPYQYKHICIRPNCEQRWLLNGNQSADNYAACALRSICTTSCQRA